MNEMNEQTKVPFYMISPMQKLYQMEMEYEKDMERMKALYPRQVQQLLPLVEDYCDGLEYEGSRIYDENPDAEMMRRECDRLIRKIKDNAQKKTDLDDKNLPHHKDDNHDESMSGKEPVQAAEIKKQSFTFTPPDGLELPPQRFAPKRLQPCTAASQPGMTPPQLGMAPPQPGMTPPQPRMAPPQSGINPPQPGMAPSQPGMAPPQSGINPPQPEIPPADWQDFLIGVLFHNEIFRRRSRHRRCCRWW